MFFLSSMVIPIYWVKLSRTLLISYKINHRNDYKNFFVPWNVAGMLNLGDYGGTVGFDDRVFILIGA